MRESFAAALAVATGSQEGKEPDPRGVLALRFYITSGTLAVVVAATAVAVLAGWWLDIPALKSVFPGFVTMKPNAALGLLLTGVALLLYRERTTSEGSAKALKILLGTTVAIAVLTVFEHLTGFSLGIDQLLARDAIPGPGAPGRMSVSSALGLLLLSGSIYLASRPGRYAWAQGLCGAAIFLATLNGVSYVFGLDQAARNAMAVHTAVCVLLVASGILFARPEQGLMDGVIDAGAGGLAIRSLVPIVFVLPLLLAWVSWLGVRLGWYGPSVAMALVVALTANALSYAVWVGAGALRASDDQRQLAEADRAESEERLRRAVADAPVPMVIHDASGRILHMSHGWSLHSGYTLAESPTMQAWIAATQPTGASPFDAYLAFVGNAVKTVHGGEWAITTLSGEKRTWDFSTTPVGATGSPDRTLVTMAVDVTDRKLSETGLRKMNEDLEQRLAERTAELTKTSDSLRQQSDRVTEQTAMLDLVRGGILVRDLYGTIRYWSAGAAEMYGWTKEEAVGKISHRLIRSELPVPLKDIEKQVTNTGSWEGDIVQTRKDGTRLAVESRWTLTRTDRGRPHGFLEVNRDVTARKDTERALEEQVSELTRSNHELEEFAYIASHDLQEPLRAVSSYTELLAQRYKDKLDSDANEYIDFALNGARRMQDLIRGLLEYARVGSRGGEYAPTPIEQVVNAALMNLSTATADANAEITVGDMPTLACDSAQLTQVFQNLISNAIKFRRPGARPVIRISAHHEEGRWSFHVADNGIGIEKKYFERIFQMFQRLHGRDEYAGTGIGLALCKKIIERHGGEMRVASEPGRGTTFSFTIPDALGLEA